MLTILEPFAACFIDYLLSYLMLLFWKQKPAPKKLSEYLKEPKKYPMLETNVNKFKLLTMQL